MHVNAFFVAKNQKEAAVQTFGCIKTGTRWVKWA